MEKVSTLISHDQMGGALSCAAMMKVKAYIPFELFKQAWHIQFQRQPMLRALGRREADDYFFDFSACFDNIPLKHLSSISSEVVDQEYSRDIIKPFDLNTYFWRASLVSHPECSESYIIFGAPHSIVDGISISWLFGDLLRVMIELNEGKMPDIDSFPIPASIDTILDSSKFSSPSSLPSEVMPLPEVMRFDQPADKRNARSENIFRTIEGPLFIGLLERCRQHQVSLTAAAATALGVSTLVLSKKKEGFFDLMIPFELRTYAQKFVPENLLAFYAHQILCGITIDSKKDFWQLAKEMQQSYQKSISVYQIPSVDDQATFEMIATRWSNKIEKQEFLRPYAFSNLGVIDAAVQGVNSVYPVESFYFTVSQQALANGLIIFAATVNNKFCLNFNFATPAFSRKKAEVIADSFVAFLTQLT